MSSKDTQPKFFNARGRAPSDYYSGRSTNPSFNMRKSQDLTNKGHRHVLSNGGDERRDLKTAGGAGFDNLLDSELLMKDVAYKAPAGSGAALLPRSRFGKSTDATAFRRSLVFNNRQRE